jgi:GNAT superfamily N-acetyltransferase
MSRCPVSATPCPTAGRICVSCSCAAASGWSRRGIATWLVGHAADWLRLGHADRLIAYCLPEQAGVLAFAGHAGLRELVRSERGWIRNGAPMRAG